jgi:hypothetical protein
MTLLSPTAVQMVAETQDTPRSALVVLLVWAVQVMPPSLVPMMVPFAPTAVHVPVGRQ